MAVIKATIAAECLALYTSAKASAMSDSDFADGMATIIQNAILSANVQIGIPVSTTGSATAQTGATTSIGTLR